MSFWFTVGMTCPVREKIDNAGYVNEVAEAKIKKHIASCQKCKDDLEKLYQSGFLNGERE